ncbi:RHS repeat-associated core domain-containing protein [Marinobacterium aestuariivivens]|uniref:RHS repeat-associated core domain-containing protein n=1 Tax=Marinobacterium aestuariivivens TaxID=1698799 RepID=A0ABW2A1N9_9GAMM
MKQARLRLFFLLAVCSVLFFGWFGMPKTAYAFHYPWDQGHDVFNPDNPPPPDKDQPTKKDNPACGGDPVNLQTGEFFYLNTYHDVAVSNLGPNLSLNFTYQSRDRYSGPFGNGWHTTLTEVAVLTNDGVDIYVVCRKGTGQRKRFSRNADGGFERPAGLFASVSVETDNSIKLVDKFGNNKTFDTTGRLVSITDSNGNTLSISYDNEGVISKATGAGGRIISFTRGANGRIASVTDPAGRVYKFDYDTNGSLTSVNDPENGITQYSYNTENKLVTITDPRGNAHVTNKYDNQNRVIQQTYADGSVLKINYLSGNNTQVTNERSLVSNYGFNESGNPSNITDPLDRSTVMEWNDDDLLKRMVNARGVERQMNYDSDGNLILLTEATGTPVERTISFEYDAKFSHLTKIIDGDGKATNIVLDSRGNPVTTINPLNDQATMTYDDRGLITSFTDANGNTAAFNYNTSGDLTQLTNAEGDVTTFTYDGAGNLLTVTEGTTSPVERTTTFSYDGLNRVTSVTDGEGGVTTFAYDPNGNLLQTVDPTGVTVTRSYDARNQLSLIVDPATGTTTLAYDATGNLVTVTDALDNTTTYSYDAADQLIATTDARGFTTRFNYDAGGNLLTVTNANNATTTYTYDSIGRRSSRLNPLGETITYAYNTRDNLIQTHDANGQTIDYAYDELGRLVSATTPDNALIYGYDAAGNMTTANDSDSTLNFTYDRANRLVSAETGGTTQPVVTLSYSYDAIGRRNSLTDSEGGSHSYSYDDADRLTELLTPANEILSMNYDAAGRPTGISYPNGVTMTNTYDLAGRVKSIIHATSSSDLVSFDYLYNALGNITQIIGYTDTRSFDYDPIQQLTSAGTNAAPAFYNYDGVGNRTSSHLSNSYSHNAANQLISDNNFTYIYDANGNLLTKTDQTTGKLINYSYDAQNQLIAISFPDGSNVNYRYDALNRRIAKVFNNSSSVFVYDGLNIVFEFSSDQALRAGYSYGTSLDQPLVMNRDGNQYYYHTDHQGSIAALTNNSTTATNTYNYKAFGSYTNTSEIIDNPFTYTGRIQDPESNLYYYRARYYDPSIGRFIQSDPIGIRGGLNTYTYVFNNPLNYVDPFGLYTLSDASTSLRKQGITPEKIEYFGNTWSKTYTDTQVFDEWLKLERANTDWRKELPSCPSSLNMCLDPEKWNKPTTANHLHPGGALEIRSKTTPGGHSSQCVYDTNRELMTSIPAGGTADFKACPRPPFCPSHFFHDVQPFNLADKLERIHDYYDVRPIK